MKTKWLMLIAFAVTFTASARQTDFSYTAEKARLFTQRNGVVLVQRPERPNEIRRKNLSYRGVAVQFIKAENPLQCINLFAPASAGSGEQNMVRDPSTGHARGLKIFSIGF